MNIVNEKTVSFLLLIVILLGIFFVIRSAIRLVKWCIQRIIKLFKGEKVQRNPLESDDWLIRAQARQEKRIENSLPPISPKAKPQKKTFKERRNERKGLSATGWYFNENTQLWEPPKK